MAEPEVKSRPIGKIWDIVSSFFSVMFKNVWKDFDYVFDDIAAKIIELRIMPKGTLEKKSWDHMLGHFVKTGLMDQSAADEVAKMRDLTFPLDIIMFFSVISHLSKDWMALNLAGASAELQQKLNAKWRPNLPGPGDILRAAFIAPEKTAEIRQIMMKNGIKDEYIDLLFLANYKLYDEDSIAMLYLRGKLSENEMYVRMRELGYTDTRIKEIKELWSIIPGIQDLIHMSVREAFSPEIAKKFGQYEDKPSAVYEWTRKTGLSDEWTDRYWAAHWDLPGVSQGYEMLHRGVISMDELKMLLRALDVMPFWRDKLIKISYQPYTRVDARRMHDLGILDDSDLLKAYMDLGYDKEHATNMMDFTIKLNRENDKEISKAEVMTGYKNRLISKSEVEIFLENMGYTKEMIDYYIATVDYKLAQEYQSDQISVIKDKFQKNLITASQARKELDALNLPAKQTDLSIEQWSIKSIKNTQLPSKEDLAGFLSAGIIPPETYADEMMKLGFPENYVAWYLQEIITKLGG